MNFDWRSKMNKTEKKVRRETVYNFYVPPPARNRKLEGADICSLPPARKSDGFESCGLHDNKTKERTLESKLKKAVEETKICNNSSLLFKTENEPVRSNQGSTETTTKKKKKKKKKSLSVDETKTENDISKSTTNNSYKTDGSVDSFSNESLINCSDENPSERLRDNTPPNVNDHELNSKPTNSSKHDDYLDIRDSSTVLNDDLEILHNLHEFTLQDNSMLKNIECCGLEFQKDNTEVFSSHDCFTNGESTKVNSSDFKKETSLVNCTETSETPNVNTTRRDDNQSLSVGDEYEWEKLLDDGFREFDFQSTPNKDTSENIRSNKTSNIEYENNDCSVIEIYGFPEEFKTQELLIPFSNFINRGFKLKWVDNTHALGIFPSPSIAEEALNSPLPFVKTRPLSQASQSSKEKAQRLTLPPALRPKTCPALARRLVSGALGVRVVFTKEEREAERNMLKEAREQKRLAAKQREAAWEGKF